MFQASSLLVNTELFNIPGDIFLAFVETALKLAAFALVLFTLMAFVVFRDKREPFQENLKGAAIIGGVAFELTLGTGFFMQAVMLTHSTSWLPALIVGFVNTMVFNLMVAIVSWVVYVAPRASRTVNEFFQRHPSRLG